MPVTKKSSLEEKKRQAEQASENQMQDLMAAISGLGTGNSTSEKTSNEKNSNSFEINTETTQNNSLTSQKEGREGDNFKTVTKYLDAEKNSGTSSESKDDKPGYVSLVIPNGLKKKWKLYSMQHGMSLTDCLKLGMKLLEEMEGQGRIKIEDGFITLNV